MVKVPSSKPTIFYFQLNEAEKRNRPGYYVNNWCFCLINDNIIFCVLVINASIYFQILSVLHYRFGVWTEWVLWRTSMWPVLGLTLPIATFWVDCWQHYSKKYSEVPEGFESGTQPEVWLSVRLSQFDRLSVYFTGRVRDPKASAWSQTHHHQRRRKT